MAGIMKFFKPTDGSGPSSKKLERGSSLATQREPFSPVGNTDGPAQRTAQPPTLLSDSDVEIVGEEVATGSKRKRGGNGPSLVAGANILAPNTHPIGALIGKASLEREAIVAESLRQLHERTTMDVELSAKPVREAIAEAAATGQMLSPDVAKLQPTPKRQRLPDDVAATASNQLNATDHQESLPPHAVEQQSKTEPFSSHADAAMTSLLAPQESAPLGSRMGDADGGRGLAEPHPQCTPQPKPAPHQPSHEDLQASPSQQSVDGTGASAAVGGGGAAGAGTAAAAVAAAAAAADATGEQGGRGTGTAGAGAKSGGTGPATLPPDMDVGATVEALKREWAGLEAALEEEVLLGSGLEAAASAAEGGRLALMPSPAELCSWLEGRTAPLSALVGSLEPLLSAGIEPAALRTFIVDLAQRKCYSEKEAPLDGVAASEDATPGRLWVWEVREPKKYLTDKAARRTAELQRKRRKELRERLIAVGSAAEALAAHQALLTTAAVAAAAGTKPPTAAARRTSESRAAKAWNRLGKLADLEAVVAGFRSAAGAVEAAPATTAATAAATTPVAAAGAGTTGKKERKDKTEKARQQEEEARAKEARKAQEEEAKRRAKETAAANKAGFTSREGLKKSQNIMESFFKRPKIAAGGSAVGGSAAGATNAGAASGAGSGREAALAGPAAAAGFGAAPGAAGVAVPAGTGPDGVSCGAVPSGAASQLVGASSQPAAPTPARDGRPATIFNFSKLVCRLPDPSVVAALDADAARLPLPPSDLAFELQRNHERWRQQRAARRRMPGVPPTWARRPTAPTDIRILAAQYYGDVAALGQAPEALRTWRRKLIAFPKKESARPPYYGSFSRPSRSVTGRRPFGRDCSLDYEVASDEEWEEEPEGESLSDSGDEADSQAGGGAGDGGEDEDDGFIVGDDHLSDDEGAQLSGDPDDPMDVDGAAAGRAAAAAAAKTAASGPAVRHMDPRLQQLEAAIDRVRSNNRPILLVKPLPPTGGPMGPPPPGVAPAPASAAAAASSFPSAAPAAPASQCQLRAEPRPGLNTGLDSGLLGALRPVVHRPEVVLAPPLELDVFSAYALAAQGGGGGGGAGLQGWLAGWGAGVPAGGLAGCEEGTLAAAFAAAAGAGGADLHLAAAAAAAVGTSGPGGVARGPGSGHRGRPPNPPLAEAVLTALAEFMERNGELRMEKIVEGFLAALPPGGKQPPKLKLREAVKRLGSWSAPCKRWVLHGTSVAAAVAHAVEAAAAAAAAVGASLGTPLSATATAAALARRSLPLTAPPLGLMTPTTLANLPAGLPAPTPAPRLGPLPSPLPTPTTGAGLRPLLQAPACTPLDLAAAHRPVGPQPAVLPQQLAQALSRLAAEAPAGSPLPAAATPLPVPGSAAGPPAVVPGPQPGATTPLAAAPSMSMPPPRMTPPSAVARPLPAAPPALAASDAKVAGATSVAAAAAVQAPSSNVDPMDCDASAPAQAHTEVGAPEPGIGSGAPPAEAVACLLQGPAERHAEAALGGDGATAEARSENGGVAEAAKEGRPEAAGDSHGTMPAAPLQRPMPGSPPSTAQLTLLGTGHPYWSHVAGWVLGGGGAAARSRKHGPAWAEVSRALAVFEAGELEQRLEHVPLDVVRALLAVCQHRRPSHLRSGAFKALGNLATALAAAAATTIGSGASGPSGLPGTRVDAAAARSLRAGTRRGRNRTSAGDAGADAAVQAAGDGPAGNGIGTAAAELRPSFQPSRCAPQPVSLAALLRLPGLLEALRRGCCRSNADSETDKAARGAARMLAALVNVGIPPLSTTAPFQQRPRGQHLDGAATAGGEGNGTAAPAPHDAPDASICPALEAEAAAFRLRVVSDPDLHNALRVAAAKPLGPNTGGLPSSARNVFTAHMLMALQRLLRDPEACPRVIKPAVRLARERAAAAEGKPALAPPSADVEGKWAAKMLQNLVVGGREVKHSGCRKGLVQCAVAILDTPRLADIMPLPPAAIAAGDAQPSAEAAPGDGTASAGASAAATARTGSKPSGSNWGALLNGNDPRAQLPAHCLTLLASELRHVTPSSERASEADAGADRPAGPPLDKCGRVRVLLALHAADRALRHLAAPASRQQLRQQDTRAAVADVRGALEDAHSLLAGVDDQLLQSLAAFVAELAGKLAA